MKQLIALFIFLLIFTSCNQNVTMSKHIDTQGHRGCRGLLPENTIPAFEKALEIGVVTLELDLAVSQDLQIIISHEPFFNHDITTPPDDIEITKDNEKDFNLYEMSYDSIKKYDVGLKEYSRFPDQKKIPVYKPRLLDMIDMAEDKAKKMDRPLPYYNMEIKSKPAWDKTFYPSVEKFVDLTIDILKDKNILDRTTIQSFDIRALQYTKNKYPEVSLVYLVEDEMDFNKNIALLGFVPDIYSPYYKFVNKAMVNYCTEQNMRLIPWTVNQRDEMIDLIQLGVDGIISDYPDVLVQVTRELEDNANH